MRTRVGALALLLSMLTLVVQCLPVFACATCGCSEICPLAMMEVDKTEARADTVILSNSIWGNIILKLAYKRDPKLQKLSKRLGFVNFGVLNSFLLVAGDTLGQNLSSVCTLNPPAGKLDSYTPGALGIAAEGATNLVLGGQMVLSSAVKSKIKQRQREIQKEVEGILQHLEFSQTECPDADKDLARIIGDRAAAECIQLWKSSHVTATVVPSTPQAKLESVDTVASN